MLCDVYCRFGGFRIASIGLDQLVRGFLLRGSGTMTHVKGSELTEAIESFNGHEQRDDGARVAHSLCSGLGLLYDLFYARMHFDVEENVGTDSMLVPVSEMKTLKATKNEF